MNGRDYLPANFLLSDGAYSTVAILREVLESSLFCLSDVWSHNRKTLFFPSG